MATVAITATAGSNAGASFRRLAKQIEQAAAKVPDVNGTGASIVLTINDAPGGSAIASVAVTGGPAEYQNGTFLV